MPGYGEDRNARVMDVVGRLGPGRSPAQAVAELEPIALRLGRDLPEPSRATAVTVSPFTGDNRPIYPFLVALMASVGLVLLIACVNVANLLLARALARARATAVRLAHGATRWHVLRQLLVESSLLTAVAGSAGVVLAMLATRLLSETLASINFPYWVRWTMDGRVSCLSRSSAWRAPPSLVSGPPCISHGAMSWTACGRLDEPPRSGRGRDGSSPACSQWSSRSRSWCWRELV